MPKKSPRRLILLLCTYSPLVRPIFDCARTIKPQNAIGTITAGGYGERDEEGMALLLPTEETTADDLDAFKSKLCATTTALRPRPSGAVLSQLFTISLATTLTLQTGCVHQPVNGLIKPMHFAFVTITPQRERGPGGWRAACIHAQINHGTPGESYICRFGVEMPIENEKNGYVPETEAQDIAARCANNAAYTVLAGMTEPTPPPLYTLCTAIRDKYRELLYDAVKGSRVRPMCDPKTKPVVFGVDAPFKP